MARVVVSELAQADTDAIIRDLVETAGYRVASNYADLFANLYDRLAAFPESGAPRPALGRHIRIGIVSPYVVFYRYRPESDVVGIVRVLHGSRDITSKLLQNKP